jgi:hypothetical protein
MYIRGHIRRVLNGHRVRSRGSLTDSTKVWKHMKHETDAFYIGWQPEAPDIFVRRVRMAVIALICIVPCLAVAVVWHQSGFATSVFDYGKPSEIEGILTTSPFPFLQVHRGVDMEGQPVVQNILLVGHGKHGVDEMLRSTEAQLGHTLDGRMVRLRGFLIYYDGKTLMEVERMTDTGSAGDPAAVSISYGMASVTGEIVDPKCLFGVMKPGYGKPHRACAARCIAGGIPPVLRSVSSGGHVQYYLLAAADGGKINAEMLPYAGDQVALCGEIRREGDWLVLYRNPDTEIHLIAKGMERAEVRCR